MSLRSRAIIATIRAANRLRERQSLKAIKGHTLRVKGKKTELKHKFKQKPKHPHGGPAQISQKGTHYGLRGRELKVGTKMARASMWHDTRARGSESWRNEMIRVFGGIHMSQTKEGAKKSVNILAKEYKKRFKKKKIKKATEGGEVSVHHNVDRSLL